MDRDAITRDIYDYLKGNFSESDLRNPRMYDEILAEIKNSFGEAAMMIYINSGFVRPPILIRDIYEYYNGTKITTKEALK